MCWGGFGPALLLRHRPGSSAGPALLIGVHAANPTTPATRHRTTAALPAQIGSPGPSHPGRLPRDGLPYRSRGRGCGVRWIATFTPDFPGGLPHPPRGSAADCDGLLDTSQGRAGQGRAVAGADPASQPCRRPSIPWASRVIGRRALLPAEPADKGSGARTAARIRRPAAGRRQQLSFRAVPDTSAAAGTAITAAEPPGPDLAVKGHPRPVHAEPPDSGAARLSLNLKADFRKDSRRSGGLDSHPGRSNGDSTTSVDCRRRYVRGLAEFVGCGLKRPARRLAHDRTDWCWQHFLPGLTPSKHHREAWGFPRDRRYAL